MALRWKDYRVTAEDVAKNGNVYVLPARSSDIENEGVLMCQLKIVEGMDSRLRKLIDLAVEWKQMVD